MGIDTPQGPHLKLVPDMQPDPMEELGISAMTRARQYATGEIEIDQEWVKQLFDDPEKGGALEQMLRSSVGVGRRGEEQEAAVDADTKAIIASLVEPGSVELTEPLARRRAFFLQLLDGMNPAKHGQGQERKK